MIRPPESRKSNVFPTLGDLEVQVLELIWSTGDATAKEAHARIGKTRGISLNTVQSAMERLYRKKLLERVKSSHAYRYFAVVEREQVIATLINEVLGRFDANASASAAAILGSVEYLDEETIAALEREIKRRRNGRGSP